MRPAAGPPTDHAASAAAAQASGTPATAPPDGTRAAGRFRPADLLPAEVPVKAPAFGDQDGEEPGVLKFDVEDADILARFAIHQETNHVIITMYQRDTGEVIREFPPRHVLDVMAALAGKGLAIDVSR
ncbi:MAG: flagellar protein FlaG [Thermoleophilia bacterium]|nr:flagellar protein FlaG [Thermoleophilia bacterium]